MFFVYPTCCDEKYVHLVLTLETRDSPLIVKENLYMNLLQTIIFSLVNKNYYYIVILFLCSVFHFTCNNFVFPLLRWSILDFNLKRIKEKIPKIFQSILCRIDKWNVFLSTNIILFDVLIILIHHFVLFFSILSQKEKLYVKRKSNIQSSYLIFFRVLCRMGIFFKAYYLSKCYHNEYM